MQKMYRESVDRGLELRKAIEPRLSFAPVVFLEPIRTDILRIRERQPLRPIVDTLPLRPSRATQAALQIVEFSVSYRDAERGDFVAHRLSASRMISAESRIRRRTNVDVKLREMQSRPCIRSQWETATAIAAAAVRYLII